MNFQEKYPLVSVVIPTSVRPSLFRAVNSALLQQGLSVEVLAVVNNTTEMPSFDDPRVRVIDARSTPGQGPARQAGIRNARGPVVALLDDDDFWEPRKCIEQIMELESFPSLADNWISATGLTLHNPDGTQVLRPRKNDLAVAVENPAEFLFARRSLRRADNFIQSSSLLFPKWIAERVPFDTLPEVCTDWGWVIAADKATRPRLIVGSGHRTHYDISVPGVSRTNRTRQILEWAELMLSDQSPRVIGDFCATTPLQVAARFGDLSGAAASLRLAYSLGRPGIPATIMAARNLARCLGNVIANNLPHRT